MSVILGNHIRKARNSKAMSCVELSIRTGISKDRVKKIENGEEPVSVKDLNTISKVLGMKREELLKNDTT